MSNGWTSITKWFVMFLAINPFFGIFFSYDIIGALASELEVEMGLQAEEIGWLYSSYSIFTPFMVFITGILTDKFGVKRMAMLMSSIAVCGTATVTYGCYHRDFWIMAGGRLATGFGESLLVVMQTIICLNFTEAWWLNIAFSMSNVWGQLGNAGVFFFQPLIATRGNLTLAMSGCFFVTTFSWLTCLAYVLIDGPKLREIIGGVDSGKDDGEKSSMKLSDIKEFPASYWCLALINCLSTCSIFVSMSFGPLFLIESAGYSPNAAGLIIALMNVTVLLAPLAGCILDVVGKRVLFWVGCCTLMTASYVVLALDRMDPVFWLMVIGFAFAFLNSSVNASISLVVPPRVYGTAYGISGVMFSISLLLIPSLIGTIRNTTGSFFVPMLTFAVINGLGTASAVALLVFDRMWGRNVLRGTAQEIDMLMLMLREEDEENRTRGKDEEKVHPTETTPLCPN